MGDDPEQGVDEDVNEAEGEEEEEMKVVSEVNSFLQLAQDVHPILNKSNQIARLRFSMPKPSIGSKVPQSQLMTDSDGDLILERNVEEGSIEEEILIEFENSTTLERVGLQVWRGAFLLSDFIVNKSEEYFKGKRIMELGSGTGFSSIVAALYAHSVVATDLNEPSILELIRANIRHNGRLLQTFNPTCLISVSDLDFTQEWGPETTRIISESQVFIVADVIYHNDITKAFIKTLKKIILSTSGANPRKNFFIAMEKRYVFTTAELDVDAPMYSYFIELLESELGLTIPPETPHSSQKMTTTKEEGEMGILSVSPMEYKEEVRASAGSSSSKSHAISPGFQNPFLNGQNIRVSIQLVRVDTSLPQVFNYEREKDLILLQIKSTFGGLIA